MNPRVTLGLLLVLVVLLGALAYSNQVQQDAAPTSTEEEPVEVFSFSIADVRRVEVHQEGQSRTFVQTEAGEWRLEPEGSPANQRVIETVLLQLTSSPAQRRIPASQADPVAYGLGSPRLTAQFHTEDGSIHGLRIGAQSPVQTGYYAQAAEGGDVFLLPNIIVAQLERLVREPFAPTPVPEPAGSPVPGAPSPRPGS